MSKNRRIPAYQKHPTGQARVRINGKDYYCGKHGTPESHARYDQLIEEKVLGHLDEVAAKTLTSILAAWWPECKRRYVKGKGKLGGAVNWQPVIRLLRENFGDLAADQVGPKMVRHLLELEAAKRDWSLTYCRDVLSKVKLIYRWAVAEELLDVAAYQRVVLCSIRHGRQTTPKPPVADEVVNQTLAHLSPKLAAMVRIQRLTGMRPGELVIMRPDDVDRRDEDVWIYTPEHHKTEHRGKRRVIYIGPDARDILAPWLLKADEYVFPTRRAEHYSSDSYRQMIHKAIDRINNQREEEAKEAGCEPVLLPRWSPNQVRKAAAKAVRDHEDVETAAAVLGHSSSVVTQDHYANASTQRAIDWARQHG
jgi:integrase